MHRLDELLLAYYEEKGFLFTDEPADVAVLKTTNEENTFSNSDFPCLVLSNSGRRLHLYCY